MKIFNLKEGMRVVDIWYSDERWGAGTVIKVVKTRAHIQFDALPHVMKYDEDHVRKFIRRK